MTKLFRITTISAAVLIIISMLTTVSFIIVLKVFASEVANETQTQLCDTVNIDSIAEEDTICNSDLEEAEQTAGFEIKLPMMSNYCLYAHKGYIRSEMPIDDFNTIDYSKSVKAPDKSRINEADESTTIKINGYTVTAYLIDKNIRAICWKDGDYYYTVKSTCHIEYDTLISYVSFFADAK